MVLRTASTLILAWVVSAALHGSLGVYFVYPWSEGHALETGDGEDDFVYEQGITIEGVGFGTGLVTTEAVEETPMEMSKAQPEIEEVVAPEAEEKPQEKPLEALPEDTEVVTSESEEAPPLEAQPQEKEVETVETEDPPPLEVEHTEKVVEQERPQKAQMATLEQEARVAVEEERQAGAEQRGGVASDSARAAYKKSLWKKIYRRARGGRSGLQGRVLVRITISETGELIDSELVESSGYKKLDRLALSNVKRAAPFKSLPQELAGKPFVATVPFNFKVVKRKRRRRR